MMHGKTARGSDSETGTRSDGPDWESDELLPRKPSGAAAYGVVGRSGDVLEQFTRMECLQEYASNMGNPLSFVWVPEEPRLQLPEQVPALGKIIHARRTMLAEANDKEARSKLLFFGLPLLFYVGWKLYERENVLTSQYLAIIGIVYYVYVAYPAYMAWKGLRYMRRSKPADLAADANEWRFEYWLRGQAVVATKLLLGALVGVYLVQLWADGGKAVAFVAPSYEAGALWKNTADKSEWWRLLSCSFLHGHPFLHLVMNCYALAYLGKRVEVLAGWPHLFLVHLIAVFCGSLVSLKLATGHPFSVGASGGLMGMLGFLLAFEMLHRRLVPVPASKRLCAGLVSVYIVGFLGYTFIDNAAHTGGLLAGAAYALIVFPASASVRRPVARGIDYIVGAVAGFALLFGAVFTVVKIREVKEGRLQMPPPVLSSPGKPEVF